LNIVWARQAALASPLFAGTWLNLGCADSAAIAGLAGYDWALIDLEHGSGVASDLVHQLTAMQGYRTATIVRVPAIDAVTFKQVLDLGPSGLMVPNVETPEQAQQALQFIRVPPMGLRGVATSTRNVGYGFQYDAYVREANDNLLTVMQIESRVGLHNVDAIAAVDGVDVLFVGPTDLSIDMGLSSDPTDAEFAAALAQVAAAAQRHGKLAGALVRNQAQAIQYQALGYRFLALGSDRGMVVKGMKDNAAFFADLAAKKP
jgi:2-keto-3-deoxy-L-rhamnonate aldolase RhmA